MFWLLQVLQITLQGAYWQSWDILATCDRAFPGTWQCGGASCYTPPNTNRSTKHQWLEDEIFFRHGPFFWGTCPFSGCIPSSACSLKFGTQELRKDMARLLAEDSLKMVAPKDWKTKKTVWCQKCWCASWHFFLDNLEVPYPIFCGIVASYRSPKWTPSTCRRFFWVLAFRKHFRPKKGWWGNISNETTVINQFAIGPSKSEWSNILIIVCHCSQVLVYMKDWKRFLLQACVFFCLVPGWPKW